MALDETLFGALLRGLRRLTRRSAEVESPHAIRTEAHEGRLRLVASLVAEEPLAVMIHEGPAGWSGRTLLLPARMAAAPTLEGNLELLLVAVLHAAMSRRLGLCLPPGPLPGRQDTAGLLGALLAVPQIHAALLAELPAAGELLARAHAVCLAARPPRTAARAARALEALACLRLGGTPEDGDDILRWAHAAAALPVAGAAEVRAATATLSADLHHRFGHGAPEPVVLWGCLREEGPALATSIGDHSKITTADPDRPTTERPGRTRVDVRRVASPEGEDEENPLVHSFEKVHTLDDYLGGRKRVDGTDELAEHADALDELALDQVVRAQAQARSLYRTQALFLGDVEEAAGEGGLVGIAYDEWDVARRAYRPGWCRVVAQVGANAPGPRVAHRLREIRQGWRREIHSLRAEMERLMLARVPRPRQLDGPEVDIDALVEHTGARRAGSAPEPRYYLSRRRAAPDVAVLILLDTSLSTDAWVDNRRILDVAIDTVMVIAEATEDIFTEVAVAGFHSNTRRDCRFVGVKAFSEPWSTGLHRLVALEPVGYTRIGPAIRHGLSLVTGARAHHRLILVISDGRPTDHDRYEGRYGLADVRQAAREARQVGVRVFGIGIDPRARVPMAEMFGLGEHQVLGAPAELPRALGTLFGHLAR